MNVELVEYTDPWCSWAWGTEPKLRRLRWRYEDRIDWRTVLGDLVPDRAAIDPDFDPVAAAPTVAGYWKNVNAHTGMPWPDGLRWAPSSSAHACRAVKAAQQHSDGAGAALLRAIRGSCFIECAPADTIERILELAARVPDVDETRLAVDVDGDAALAAFVADRTETRRPNEYVRTLEETHEGKGNAKREGDVWRYVFPTVLFRGAGGEHTVPGWQPWERYVDAMEAAVPGSTADPRPDPTPEQAGARWPSLTRREVEFLCG
jgi:protein-disulfide isomerase-like protein with CxxC motif